MPPYTEKVISDKQLTGYLLTFLKSVPSNRQTPKPFRPSINEPRTECLEEFVVRARELSHD